MYTVIGNTKSRTLRVLWMLEELGARYEHRPESPRSDAVRALNPTGKIPVLLDNDVALTDSTAILTFLADRHERLTFPSGTIERARQDAATQFILDEMDAVLWMAARHSFILPEHLRVPQIKDSLKWEFDRAQTRFAQMLGDRPFVMGDAMTIPDILAAHCGGWAVTAKFPVSEPKFRTYVDRLRSRPAFQRALSTHGG